MTKRGIALGLTVFSALAAGSAEAAFPGRNGQVAFGRFPLAGCSGCHHQIYVASRSGSHVHPLTHTDTDKFSPTYSADGRKIAFVEIRPDRPTAFSHISIMDADGEHRRGITHAKAADAHPAFRPDGRRLAFTRRGTDVSLYAINTDGSGLRLLTHNGMAPSFSPSGRQIVFEGWHGDRRGIFAMDSDGANRHQLTNDPLSDPDPLGNREYLHVDRTPSFGPEGNSVVFIRAFGGCIGGDVYVMRANGTHAHDLTPHDAGTCNPYTDPTFSADGRRIVFVGGSHLFVMNRDGSHRKVFTEKTALYGAPSWQPLPRDDDPRAR